jgi:hypothetical protein
VINQRNTIKLVSTTPTYSINLYESATELFHRYIRQKAFADGIASLEFV